MNLSHFPRVALAHLPTPLERLDKLTRALGGPEIWIKRDDCTGLSTGGNKARKLEFLMADAVAAGANLIITAGGTQSNHARQTAAAAACLGLHCYILLENRTGKSDFNYVNNGNVLLDVLHGATIQRCEPNDDINAEMGKAADRLRSMGHKVYTIPIGGSNPVGALGYVNAAIELVNQVNAIGLQVNRVIHATGSAGTQAGLAVGLADIGSDVRLLGISVRAQSKAQEESVFDLACATARKCGVPNSVRRDHVEVKAEYVGAGYGLPGSDTIEAIQMLAKLEGILLDPVYSGKSMAGLIDLCRSGAIEKSEKIVFLHTGGSVALFGYPRDISTQH